MKDSTVIITDELIHKYPALISLRAKLFICVNLIVNSYKEKGKVLTVGNGGSASDAMHIVGELMKSFKLKRKIPPKDNIYSDYLNANLECGIPAVSLVSETSFLSAWANDRDPYLCYAQQIHAIGNKEDVVIAISTSGNSKNIIFAAEVAKAKQIPIISLTGQSGGELTKYSDVLLNVPYIETAQIQELHLPIYHAICAAVENEIYEE